VSVLRDIALTLRPRAGDRHGPLVPMMVALTVLTGVVDAISYLKLGHVFVANMTGNVVFLGFALAGAGSLSVAASLIALGSFLLGAFAGGWLVARHAEHRGRLLRAANVVQAALILVALVLGALCGGLLVLKASVVAAIAVAMALAAAIALAAGSLAGSEAAWTRS
jgi:uncharacterized membrane protein YoaK (UPF0700 family)